MSINKGLGSSDQNAAFLARAKELALEASDDWHLSDLLDQPFQSAYPEWRMRKIEISNPLFDEMDVTCKLWMAHPLEGQRLLQGAGESRSEAIVSALTGSRIFE